MFEESALDRLANATSAATLAPMLATGPAGRDVAVAVDGFASQLTQKPVRPSRGDARRAPALRPAEFDGILAEAAVLLAGSQPAQSDVGIDLYTSRPEPTLAGFQETAIAAAFTAATVLVAAGRFGRSDDYGDLEGFRPPSLDADDLMRLAGSATPAGRLFRDLFGGPRVGDQPWTDPDGGGGIPGYPGLDPDLLRLGEELAQRGCGAAAAAAVGRWAGAVASGMPRYLKDVIDRLDPADACPGQTLTIEGHDLGDGQGRAVVFTRHGGGPTVVPTGNIQSWRDDAITLTVPADAGRGPVGIVDLPTDAAPLAEAAAEAVGEMGTCFGPAATVRLQATIGRMTVPPLAAPTLQADRANLYEGGAPTIRSFNRTPGTALHPDQQVRLSWWVEDATDIEIIVRPVAGSAAHELPPITQALPWASGSVSVTIPGTRSWDADYVLRAFNGCTGRTKPTESALRMSMHVRTGLALGGGGTRGDFQVGALTYLYDVKGFRPQAIAATSVGAVNAMDLVMGDDPSMSAASRLASTWLSLQTEADMWMDMPWLASAKQHVKQLVRSFSIEGLLSLPYTLIADGIAIGDLKGTLDNLRGKGATAFFTLAPIETRMRSQFVPARAAASGIALRNVAVSVETGQLVEIDEQGFVFDFQYPAAPPPPGVASAPPRDAIDGAIASSTMPGIFPARRIGNHTCVDGGVREVVPVATAIEHLGCNVVYAIRLGAPPAPLPLDPGRTFPSVMSRSVLELTYDEVAQNDVDPDRWGPEVTIHTIASTMSLHDALVIEPGLIRIAIDYGWMRAADAVDVDPAKRATAMRLSDGITGLRALNWELAHQASGVRVVDPHRSFDAFLINGGVPSAPSVLVPIPDPAAIDAIRANCLTIRSLLIQRLALGAPTQASAIRTAWFTQFEMISSPPLSPDPWASFASRIGTRPAVTPPTAV